MTADAATNHHPSSLSEYLDVVRRRKWFILQAALLVPITAVLLSFDQPKVFQSSAQVLLNRGNLANGLTGTPDASLFLQADRVAQTQADLARTAPVVRNTLKATHVRSQTVAGFLGNSSVAALPNSDVLEFTVKAGTPKLSRRLATEYARQYTLYRRKLDISQLNQARSSVERSIAQLKAQGVTSGASYKSLVQRKATLRTMEALQAPNASVVQTPTGSAQVSPRPKRNAAIAVVLGLVLGLILAFLVEALDTRVRSSEEVSERLGRLPLLGRVPRPPRKLRRSNRLAMLAAPNGADAEAFRMLRSQLDLARLDTRARSIMVTSAVAGEGKTTTVANLAVAIALTGERVILVDLDLYNPSLHRFFQLGGRGITDVALGHVTLDDALVSVPVSDMAHDHDGYGVAGTQGVLQVLPSGSAPSAPSDFINTASLDGLLTELRSRADVVLIDSSPLPLASAAVTLSTKVDGVLVISQVGGARRKMLAEFSRLLARSPAAKLGLIVTGASDELGYDVYPQTQAYLYNSARESRRGVAP